jgi:hypothetical protein
MCRPVEMSTLCVTLFQELSAATAWRIGSPDDGRPGCGRADTTRANGAARCSQRQQWDTDPDTGFRFSQRCCIDPIVAFGILPDVNPAICRGPSLAFSEPSMRLPLISGVRSAFIAHRVLSLPSASPESPAARCRCARLIRSRFGLPAASARSSCIPAPREVVTHAGDMRSLALCLSASRWVASFASCPLEREAGNRQPSVTMAGKALAVGKLHSGIAFG